MAEYSSFNKIPYDSQPIHRQTSYKGSPRRAEGGNGGSNGTFRSGLALVVCILVLINIILGGLVISVLKKQKSSVNHTDITINSTGGIDVSAVVKKASPSMVLVHSGVPEGVEVSDQSSFLKMTETGAGVIFDDDKREGIAYILTCYHVIMNSPTQIYVTLYDNTTPIKASLVKNKSYSSIYDIAILKIDASLVYASSSAKPCEVADSSYLSVGDDVVAIGNPLTKGFSVTKGIVSKTNGFIETRGINKRGICIDAGINGGNSGGGLFDASGRLVGIVNAKEASSVENMAYAVHSNVAINLALNMLENDQPMKAVLGMKFEALGRSQIMVDEKLYIADEVYISSVDLGTAAAKAGLVGDKSEKVLGFTINGKYHTMMDIYTFEDYSFTLSEGDTVTFKLSVHGQEREVSIGVERVVSVDSTHWY